MRHIFAIMASLLLTLPLWGQDAKQARQIADSLKTKLEGARDKLKEARRAAEEAEEEIKKLEVDVAKAEVAIKDAEHTEAALRLRPPSDNTALIVVKMPSQGELIVDSMPTPNKGYSTRTLRTPPLEAGVAYYYDMRCILDGKTVTSRVTLVPNQILHVDFSHLEQYTKR